MCKGRLIEFSIYSLSVCGQRRQSCYQVFLKKKKKKMWGRCGVTWRAGPAHARRGWAPAEAGPREIRRRGPAQPARRGAGHRLQHTPRGGRRTNHRSPLSGGDHGFHKPRWWSREPGKAGIAARPRPRIVRVQIETVFCLLE